MKLARSASPYAILVAAVAAAYANALGASFQFDDWNVIVDQPKVHGLAAWWDSMPGIRPLLKLSYALNWAISPGPFGFHLTNVAIHAANACLLLAIWGQSPFSFKVAHDATLKEKGDCPHIALVAALIFALHPVQTEAVTYVSGRSSSLAALFVLASVYAWTVAKPVACAALFACAVMVRETSIVLPLAIVLLESGARPWTREKKRGLLLLLAVAVGAAAVALASTRYRYLLDVSLSARGIGTNLLTQAHAVVYLMGQLVRFDRLNADPALSVITAWSVRSALEVTLVAGLVLLGGISLIKRGLSPLLWFFLWLLPTNSILPRLDVANDRQLYLALAGPAWLAAHAVGTVARRRGNVFPLAAAVVLALGLATATHLRNRLYADEVTFWDDVAAKAPHNGRAFNNLGYALALAGRRDEAEQAFRRATAIDPQDVRAGVNLRLLREGGLVRRPDSR